MLSHYRKSILRQTYDNRVLNRKIFCKSGPRFRRCRKNDDMDAGMTLYIYGGGGGVFPNPSNVCDVSR